MNRSQNNVEDGQNRLQDLTEGIVGLKNNSLFCYMNAFMQCMAPII